MVLRWNVSCCWPRTVARGGAASCRLSSCSKLLYTGWRDSFAQQRARPDFVTETESDDDDYDDETQSLRLAAHTHTHTIHAPGPVGDRHTTGGARTLRDDDYGTATKHDL